MKKTDQRTIGTLIYYLMQNLSPRFTTSVHTIPPAAYTFLASINMHTQQPRHSWNFIYVGHPRQKILAKLKIITDSVRYGIIDGGSHTFHDGDRIHSTEINHNEWTMERTLEWSLELGSEFGWEQSLEFGLVLP